MSETWMKISGYSNYEASSLGRIKNLKTDRVLKSYKNKKGYETVRVKLNGSWLTTHVHKLVMMAFDVDNISETVNHKNGIKHDNRVDNLEWMTFKENTQHAYHVLGAGNHKNRKLDWAQILTMATMSHNWSDKAICDFYEVNKKCIYNCRVSKSYKEFTPYFARKTKQSTNQRIEKLKKEIG